MSFYVYLYRDPSRNNERIYVGKVGHRGPMSRWHFDNCKVKQ